MKRLPYDTQIIWRDGHIVREQSTSLSHCTWPGAYPLFYLDSHDEVLCPACADTALKVRDSNALCDGDDFIDFGDAPVNYDVHWEGSPLVCEECGTEIESAYGDPEED